MEVTYHHHTMAKEKFLYTMMTVTHNNHKKKCYSIMIMIGMDLPLYTNQQRRGTWQTYL